MDGAAELVEGVVWVVAELFDLVLDEFLERLVELEGLFDDERPGSVQVVDEAGGVDSRVDPHFEYSGREEIALFAVSVSCSPGVDQGQELSFDGVINLPSGRMSVGDADTQEMLTLAPGTYRIQIEVHPHDHPEHVRFWYSPA